MSGNRITGLALIAAAAVLTVTAAPQHVLAANDSKHISDGAAKGQATEETFHPTAGGGGHHHRRKLPGRMKSGTLTLTRAAPHPVQHTTKKPPSNNMIGNHKD